MKSQNGNFTKDYLIFHLTRTKNHLKKSLHLWLPEVRKRHHLRCTIPKPDVFSLVFRSHSNINLLPTKQLTTIWIPDIQIPTVRYSDFATSLTSWAVLHQTGYGCSRRDSWELDDWFALWGSARSRRSGTDSIYTLQTFLTSPQFFLFRVALSPAS